MYGTIFSCKHKLDGQVNAVKIIKFNKDDDQNKILREVKALAKCNHKKDGKIFYSVKRMVGGEILLF